MAERKIVWNPSALKTLEEALQWISEQSVTQAENIETAILSKLEKSKENPERYPPDRYKNNNDGHYRSFNSHSYRISFKFTEKEIVILRVRHVKQRPQNY